MAEWVKPAHGKGDIDRAGASLVPWWKGEITIDEQPKIFDFYKIAENWRSSHAMPLLTFRINLGERARRIDPNRIVAQRMKRFSSLMNKLVREENMKLSQMQDLGGCRAILKDVGAAQRVYQFYQGGPPFGDGLKCYDYIQNPKADGYRGIHVIGRYQARLGKNRHWNGQRIEIQLRSQ